MKRLSVVAVLAAALLQVCTANAQGNDADLDRIRAQLKDLERKLDDLGGKAVEPRRIPSAADMRANMETLRETDPARYAQMTNSLARIQERHLQRTDRRLNILASVDTSRFTAKERQVHESLQAAIVKREALRQRLNPQNVDVTEEQRSATFEELRNLEVEIRQLEASEREALLLNMARTFGLSAEKAKEVVEAIKVIDEATNGGSYRSGPSRAPRLPAFRKPNPEISERDDSGERSMTTRERLQSALDRADFESARQPAMDILEDDADDPGANFAVGMWHYQHARWKDAEKYLLRCTRKRPKDAAVWNNLALIYMNLGMLDVASRYAHKALSLLPDSADIKDTIDQIESARNQR